MLAVSQCELPEELRVATETASGHSVLAFGGRPLLCLLSRSLIDIMGLHGFARALTFAIEPFFL